MFGGAPAGGIGHWDCSSFVNWVVGHDCSMAIPGYGAGAYNGDSHGTVVLDWAVWSGAATVKSSPSRGDLCVWAGVGASGHMGIALDATHMISALNHIRGTIQSPIAGYGPLGVPVIYRSVGGNTGSTASAAIPGCLMVPGLAAIVRLCRVSV